MDRLNKYSASSEASAAISRWEGEGGAPMNPNLLARRHGDLTESERHILECLGAAVVKEWSDLPTAVQRSLFQRATANEDEDPAQLKALIARFLHNRKEAPVGVQMKAELDTDQRPHRVRAATLRHDADVHGQAIEDSTAADGTTDQ